MSDEENRNDEDVIDPEDIEIEIEDEESEENPSEEVDPVEDDGSGESLDEEVDDNDMDDDSDILLRDEPKAEDLQEVGTAKYLVTGLVDYTDEQGIIRGQLEKGIVHELPVEVGDRAVEQGQAERVE